VTPTSGKSTTTAVKTKVIKHLADDTHFSDLLNDNNTKS